MGVGGGWGGRKQSLEQQSIEVLGDPNFDCCMLCFRFYLNVWQSLDSVTIQRVPWSQLKVHASPPRWRANCSTTGGLMLST